MLTERTKRDAMDWECSLLGRELSQHRHNTEFHSQSSTLQTGYGVYQEVKQEEQNLKVILGYISSNDRLGYMIQERGVPYQLPFEWSPVSVETQNSEQMAAKILPCNVVCFKGCFSHWSRV